MTLLSSNIKMKTEEHAAKLHCLQRMRKQSAIVVNGKLDPLIQTATNLPSRKCVETRLVAMTIFQPWLSTTRTIQNATFWGFVATTTAKLHVAAVANMKKVNPSMAWIEAVRTSRHYRNNGLAFTLLHSMLKDARNSSYKKVWSCTVRPTRQCVESLCYK